MGQDATVDRVVHREHACVGQPREAFIRLGREVRHAHHGIGLTQAPFPKFGRRPRESD